jgi:hypothetical protein
MFGNPGRRAGHGERLFEEMPPRIIADLDFAGASSFGCAIRHPLLALAT